MKGSFTKSFSLLMASFLFILPGVGERKENVDFLVKKTLMIGRNGTALFPVQVERNSFSPLLGSPELIDPIDPGAVLSKVTPEPDYYWEKGSMKTGYPGKGDYTKVKSLGWIFKPQKKWQHEASASTISYQYNCHYREDLDNYPEFVVTEKVSIPLENATPLLQIVEGKQRLFVSLAEGSLRSIDPITLQVYWNYSFPMGESISNGFVTYIRENKSYILCVTNRSRLYLFSALDGSVLWKKEIEGMLSAPLASIEKDSETIVSLLTDKVVMLIDPYRQKILLEKKIPLSTPLSPLLVQIPGDYLLILSYQNGMIQALALSGEPVWGLQIKGEILYDPSLLVRDGLLHLLVSSTEKILFWIDGRTGAVKATDKLPGIPRSPISLASEGISYSLLTSRETPDSPESYFYSGSFENTNLPRVQIPIPGDSFLGLVGMRTKYNECYYICSSDYRWTVINKANRTLTDPYPVQILKETKSLKGFLSGRDMILVEGSILLNLHENGLLIIGTPFQPGINHALKSSASNHSEDFGQDSQNYSGGRGRTDLDYLAEPKLTLQKKWDIAPYDNFREILTPQTIYLEKQNQWVLVMPGKNGKVSFMDKQGELIHQYEISKDPLFVQPIILQNPDGSLFLYAISTGSLSKSLLDPSLKKIKVIWKMDDMGSLGGNFTHYRLADRKVLLFVDTLSYLTCLDEDKKDILYRIKVDATSFVIAKQSGVPYVYCGSKTIQLKSGKEVFKDGSSGSESTVVGALGTTFLLQSNDLDMICRDSTGEIRWMVRKLWCKAYCFGYHAPAIYRTEDQVFTFWADYKRIICVDLSSGMIRWIYFTPDDYFHSKPTVTVVEGRPYVYAGSIRGNLYMMDGISGLRVSPYPLALPGKEEQTDSLKGLSSPVILNGCIFITRIEFGMIRIGDMKPENQRFKPVFVTLVKKDSEKKSFIFNRATLYWDTYYRFSPRVKWKITEGIPIIFLTFLKKMKKLK